MRKIQGELRITGELEARRSFIDGCRLSRISAHRIFEIKTLRVIDFFATFYDQYGLLNEHTLKVSVKDAFEFAYANPLVLGLTYGYERLFKVASTGKHPWVNEKADDSLRNLLDAFIRYMEVPKDGLDKIIYNALDTYIEDKFTLLYYSDETNIDASLIYYHDFLTDINHRRGTMTTWAVNNLGCEEVILSDVIIEESSELPDTTVVKLTTTGVPHLWVEQISKSIIGRVDSVSYKFQPIDLQPMELLYGSGLKIK